MGHVYFNHSIHVGQAVGCATCRGRVDRMPLIRQAAPLTMQWWRGCHCSPELYVRPRFEMDCQPLRDQRAVGERLVEEYGIGG